MTQASYTLDPAGNGVDSALPWVAQSVQIDNPTGQWWYIPGAGQFIGPYTIGASFSLVPASPQARIIKQTPPGVLSSPKAGETSSVTFNTLDAPDTPGFNIGNQATITPPSNILFFQAVTGVSNLLIVPHRTGFKFRVTSIAAIGITNNAPQAASVNGLYNTFDDVNPTTVIYNILNPSSPVAGTIGAQPITHANDSGITETLPSGGINTGPMVAGTSIYLTLGGLYVPN